MKKEKNSIIILCIYFITMLLICALSVQALKKVATNNNTIEDLTNTEIERITEIVYVPIFSESTLDTTSDSETDPSQEEYTVKSYEGKIGIFYKEDTLIRIIDVYVKTLPKADQTLLEKGLLVTNEAELRSIIEDYTW